MGPLIQSVTIRVRHGVRPVVLLLAASIGIGGCLSPGAGGSRTAGGAKTVIRDTQTGEIRQELTRLELQDHLFDLCDTWASLNLYAFDTMIAQTTDPKVRSALVEGETRTVVSGFSIGANLNPLSGILDMLVLSRLLSQYWSGTRAEAAFGEMGPRVHACLADAEAQIWKSGEQLLTPAQQQDLKDRIDLWLKTTPDLKAVSFARLSDIDSVYGASLEKQVAISHGLFQVLDDAVRSAEELRLLGERSLWLAARAPILARLATESSVVAAFDVPQVRDVVRASEALPIAVQSLSTRVEAISADIDRQRAAIDQSIQSAGSQAKELLGETHEIAKRLESSIKEAYKVTSERSEIADAAALAAKEFRQAVEAIHSIIQKVAPEGSQPGGSSQTVQELARAAEQLNAAVTKLQQMTASGEPGKAFGDLTTMANAQVANASLAGENLIDRAFWRCAVLLAVAFGLAIAYRWLLPRLVRVNNAASNP